MAKACFFSNQIVFAVAGFDIVDFAVVTFAHEASEGLDFMDLIFALATFTFAIFGTLSGVPASA